MIFFCISFKWFWVKVFEMEMVGEVFGGINNFLEFRKFCLIVLDSERILFVLGFIIYLIVLFINLEFKVLEKDIIFFIFGLVICFLSLRILFRIILGSVRGLLRIWRLKVLLSLSFFIEDLLLNSLVFGLSRDLLIVLIIVINFLFFGFLIFFLEGFIYFFFIVLIMVNWVLDIGFRNLLFFGL